MLTNRAETAVINSAARRGLRRCCEAPLLARQGGRVTGGRVLEVGCGLGAGTWLITRVGGDCLFGVAERGAPPLTGR